MIEFSLFIQPVSTIPTLYENLSNVDQAQHVSTGAKEIFKNITGVRRAHSLAQSTHKAQNRVAEFKPSIVVARSRLKP
jgi:hypothetical protein